MMFEFFEQNFLTFTEDGIRTYLSRIKDASFRLSDMVTRILSYYTNSDLNTTEIDVIELPTLFAKILSICDPEGTIEPQLLGKCKEMRSYSVVIELILLNLIVNALKYNDKETVRIELTVTESAEF